MPTEHDEQVALCRYLDFKRIRYFSIPNGGQRNIVTAARLKAEGCRRGVPDLAIFLPNGTQLFLEMKKRDGGRLSAEQKEWIYFLNTRLFCKATVAHGAQEAIKIIEEEKNQKEQLFTGFFASEKFNRENDFYRTYYIGERIEDSQKIAEERGLGCVRYLENKPQVFSLKNSTE